MGGRLCYIYDSSKNHNTAVSCQRFPLTQNFIGFPHSFPILSLSCFHCSLTSGPVAALHSFWKLTEKREKQNTEASGLCSLGRPAIKWKKKSRKPVSSFPSNMLLPGLHVRVRPQSLRLILSGLHESQLAIRVFPLESNSLHALRTIWFTPW